MNTLQQRHARTILNHINVNTAIGLRSIKPDNEVALLNILDDVVHKATMLSRELADSLNLNKPTDGNAA